MTPLNKINSRPSRIRRVFSSAFLCALIAVATAFPGSAQEAPSPTPRPLDKGLPPASPIVDQLLQRLSLEAKVGQIMVVAFSGDTPTSDVLGLIDSQRVGGVILFQDNVGRGSPERVRSMTDSLQSRARAPQGGKGSDPGVPLLMAVDQEGGPVVRVGEAATLFPGAMALGASGSVSLVMRSASAVARELRSLGINVNLGPVVDVNSNPQNPVIGTRSFGADPAMVGRLATAAIRGQQRAGVLAIAKHWPGHGDADVDSHLALPLLAHSRSRLDLVESPPFRAAVDAGVAGIMTAHLDVPVLTTGESANMPVSLSPKALAELRTLVGEDRLIVSDDLEMGAIVQRFGTAGSALRAFSGGSDLLLFRRDAVQARRAHSEIVAAVRKGSIPMARLDASVRRVLRAKDAVGLLSDVPADMDVPESPEIVASDIAQQAITLIQDGQMLPLRSADHPRICVVQPRLREIAGQEIVVPVTGPATLADAVRALHPAIQVVEVGLDPPRPERLAASECARSAGLVIVGTYNTGMFASQPILLDALRLADVPIIVVALRLPYDYSVVGEIDAFVTGYSMRPASLQAVARTIFGVSGAAPTGSLPVPLGKSYPVGYQYPTPDAWLFPQS